MRTTLALLAAVVLLLAAAGLPGAAAAHAATPDVQLLATYEPVMQFDPLEQFRPTKVQSFLTDANLEQLAGSDWSIVQSNPPPGNLPDSGSGTWRLDQAGCSPNAPIGGLACYETASNRGGGGPTIYGRVVHQDGDIVLQYWFFYYDDALILPPVPIPGYGPATFWQSHEGDWEVANVILDPNGNPVEAAYSQHCSGQRKAWGDVQKWPAGSTHPVDYVALGSHANYFAPGAGPLGAIPINPACIPSFVPAMLTPYVVDQVVDGSSVGAVVGPPGTGAGVEHASIKKIDGEGWASFGGRWGESEYFYTPIPLTVPGLGTVPGNTALPMGLSPASPANQANWQPATVLGWPSS